MTHKRFWFSIVSLMLVMAVFIVGGCGGSSNNPPSSNNQDEEDDSQFADTKSEEYKIVFGELEEELKAEGLTVPPIHYVAVLSGDHAIIEDDLDSISDAGASGVRASTTLPDSEIERMSAALKPYYDSGDVIAIVFPEPETINDVFAAIGEPQAYIDPVEMIGDTSEDLVPLVYAVAKRYNGEAVHRFSYVLPLDIEWFVEELVEAYSEDKAVSDNPSNGEIGDAEEYKYEGLDERALYQARRMADFHRWAAHIDSDMEEQVSYVSSSSFPLRSAGWTENSKSGELFNYSAEKITLNLSVSSTVKWGPSDIGRQTCNFSSGVSYMIYSFHDFGDGKDYYYVQANNFGKPESYREWTNSSGTKYTLGSVGYYDFRHTLTGNVNYSLFSNAPKNVNRSRTLSDGTNYSTTRTTGHKVSTEVGMEAGTEGGKMSMKAGYEYSTSKSNTSGYNHSATWTTNDWEIINNCNNTMAAWRIDFKDPNYSTGGPDGYYPHWDGSVADATKQRADLDSEWMWQVNSAPKNLSIKAQVGIYYRQTGAYSIGTRSYSYGARVKNASSPIAQPPHIIVNQKQYSFRRSGDVAQFKLLCSGHWEATSDQNWCQVSPSSGEATGGDERDIFINVEAFEQDGSLATRIGHISLKDTTTGQTQTLWITQANK